MVCRFFTVICAVRWNVGADAITYAFMFENGDYRKWSEINGEILFYGLTKLSSQLSIPFVIGMGLCAFFQIYPITKALKEHKYVLIVLPFVLFGSRFFGFEQRCPPDDSGIHVYIRQSIHC